MRLQKTPESLASTRLSSVLHKTPLFCPRRFGTFDLDLPERKWLFPVFIANVLFTEYDFRHHFLTFQIRQIQGRVRISVAEALEIKAFPLLSRVAEYWLMNDVIKRIFRPFILACDLIADCSMVIRDLRYVRRTVIQSKADIS